MCPELQTANVLPAPQSSAENDGSLRVHGIDDEEVARVLIVEIKNEPGKGGPSDPVGCES